MERICGNCGKEMVEVDNGDFRTNILGVDVIMINIPEFKCNDCKTRDLHSEEVGNTVAKLCVATEETIRDTIKLGITRVNIMVVDFAKQKLAYVGV